MNSSIQYTLVKKLLLPFSLLVCMIVLYISANAQEQPPRPIEVIRSTEVITARNLNFGTFCFGDGSDKAVVISSTGSRSCEGNIVLISSSSSAALFIVKTIPGTLITIRNGPNATLKGSNGGEMIMEIGDSFPLSPLITTSDETSVTIGGKLHVDTSTTIPPGNYSGKFIVTFDQQ